MGFRVIKIEPLRRGHIKINLLLILSRRSGAFSGIGTIDAESRPQQIGQYLIRQFFRAEVAGASPVLQRGEKGAGCIGRRGREVFHGLVIGEKRRWFQQGQSGASSSRAYKSSSGECGHHLPLFFIFAFGIHDRCQRCPAVKI